MSTPNYQSGYDVPIGGGGNYLTLTSKGQKERVRLLFAPIVFEETFPEGGKFESETAKRAAWVALKRNSDGSEPVTFKASAMVYKAVQKLFRNEDWGDPSEYDVVVERTEEKGAYYLVTPTKPKPLTDEEKAAVAEFVGADADDWADMQKGVFAFLEARYLKPKTNGDKAAGGAEYDPFSEE